MLCGIGWGEIGLFFNLRNHEEIKPMMNNPLINRIACALILLFLSGTPALAQQGGATSAQTTKKPAAAKKAPQKKAPKKVQSAAPKKKNIGAGVAAAVGSTALAAAAVALTPEQHTAAASVHTGRMTCDLDAFIQIDADTQSPGRFHVQGKDWQKKNFKYHMTPVVTSTGAVRLEDAQAQAVWLQIPAKSMLMNQKLGQRMADGCMSAQQTQLVETMAEQKAKQVAGVEPAAPPLGLLD